MVLPNQRLYFFTDSIFSFITESACAGALGVQLAGPAYYFGQYYPKLTIGDALRPIEPEDILRANRMMYVASSFALAWGCAFRALF